MRKQLLQCNVEFSHRVTLISSFLIIIIIINGNSLAGFTKNIDRLLGVNRENVIYLPSNFFLIVIDKIPFNNSKFNSSTVCTIVMFVVYLHQL